VLKNCSKAVVKPAPVVAEILSLNNTMIVEVIMLDDSNIDTEHLAMTKTRITKIITDVHTQTYYYYLAIQIQSNRLEAAHL